MSSHRSTLYDGFTSAPGHAGYTRTSVVVTALGYTPLPIRLS